MNIIVTLTIIQLIYRKTHPMFFFFFSLLLRCYIRKPKPYSYRVCSIYFTLIPHFSFIDLQNINCFQIGVMLEEKHSYFTATPLHHQDNTDLQCSRSQRERRLSTMPNFLLLNHLDVFLQYRGDNFNYKRKKKKKRGGGAGGCGKKRRRKRREMLDSILSLPIL